MTGSATSTTVRIANKTIIRLSPNTTVEVGGFVVDRHLMHPIFQWLDYQYEDYGGFARMTDERYIGGFKNRLIVGVNLHNGEIDNQQYRTTATAAVPSRARCYPARSTSQKILLPTSRTRSTSCPPWRWWPARSSCTRRASGTDRFLSNGDQSGHDRVRRLEPESWPALERRSDLAGLCQRLAQCRGAELR